MRQAFLILGLLALTAAWLTDLPHVARRAFWAHMTMHIVVVAVASPCLALGIAGTRLDPVAKAPRLLAPIPLSIVELVIVWAWHAPALHHAARQSTLGLVAEQATFLICGFAVWLSAFGGDARHNQSRRAAGIVALLLTSMHMTLLGALLALAPRPLYVHTAGVSAHLDETSAITSLHDQHLGGAIMLLVGGISYLSGGVWLTAALVRDAGEEHDKRAQVIGCRWQPTPPPA